LTRIQGSAARLETQLERSKDSAASACIKQSCGCRNIAMILAGTYSDPRCLTTCSLLDSADLTQGDSSMKLSIALLAAVLSTAAFAQQEQQRSPTAPNYTQPPATETAPHASPSIDVGAVFDKLNTTHDGKLTRQQAQAHPTVAANFDSVDTNHDGVISREEFLAAFKPQQ
jgi:EF hand